MQENNKIDELREQALSALDGPEPVKKGEKNTYSFSELWALKDVEQKFLVPELLPGAAMAVIIGEDGIGKTQITSQLCLSICLGYSEFMGLPLHAPNKRALIVATEDSKEKFSKSITKQARYMQVKLDPDNIHLSFMEASNFDDLDRVCKEIDAILKAQAHDLIVCDAFSDFFTLIDGEINSNSHARKILNKFQKIINDHGTTILFIHHAAKSKIVEKQRNGKMFVEKGDSQGAGAITQKPRTILALTHNPGSIKDEGLRYTNYLHVVKANLMSKMYVTQAIELEFDASMLLHFAKGLVNIQMMENPDGPQQNQQQNQNVNNKPAVKTVLDFSDKQHIDFVAQAFEGETEMSRADLVSMLKGLYQVGKNKIEEKSGFLQYLQDRNFIHGANGKFTRMEYVAITMPTLDNFDLNNLPPDDEEPPF